ncbi:phospholipid carrier-dependent glycosyltransferase [soil metagenome]
MNAEAQRGAALDLRSLLLLMLAAVAILAPGISSLPPVDRDEPRYETATTQMLKTGDFVDIRYQEQPRYLQPAGVYWLQAIPTALFSAPGHRAVWTYRLPSLLGALLATLITTVAAGRLFGRQVGVGAGVFLASCLSLGFEARIGKTDGALLAATAAAQFALMRLYLDPPAKRWVAAAFWAALGVGVLLKGPIPLLVSGLTVLALVAWDRRVGWLKRLHAGWGAPLALLIAAPWYVAIGLVSHGGFFRTAIGKSMMGKVAVGQQAHGAPFGYHFVGLPLTFWPASLLLAGAAVFAWRERARPQVRFLIAWIAPSWIVFELIKTKLPHYVLPLFPALACLAALALFSARLPTRAWQRWLFGAFVVLWLLASGVLSALSPVALFIYEKRVDAVAVALCAASLACVVALLVCLIRGRREGVVAAVAGAAAFTAVNLYVVGLPGLNTLWLSPRAVRLAKAQAPCPTTRLISTPYHEPSLVFLNGPDRTFLAQNPDEAAQRLSQDRACGLALIGEKERGAFEARARTEGLALRPVGGLTGRDYADGRDLTLTLYAAAPPALRP